eukprot:scaffold2069_cov187-Amphora_coffeaeformis.AAC.26
MESHAKSSEWNSLYTRSEWSALPIQERIRAMNELNVDPFPQQDEEGRGDEQPQQVVEEHPYEGGSTAEPPRRASVVEMWRRRDNQSASTSSSTTSGGAGAGAGASPSDKSSNPAAATTDPIENSRQKYLGEEDEKKEENEGHRQLAPKPSAIRNMWNQRATNPTTSETPSSSSSLVNNHSATRSAEKSANAVVQPAQHAVVDMSIVQSPAKLPVNEDEAAAAAAPTTTTAPRAARPSNVVNFWAQRGLKPITPGDDSVTTAASSVVASWKQRDGGASQRHQSSPSSQPSSQQQHANLELDSAANSSVGATSTPGKLSVVDRWKQRVSSPARSLSDEQQQVPSSPAKKPSVVERWTSVVKKPEPPVPKAKVSDRWINRQQPENRVVGTPKKSMHASIPGIPASPTSRTHTTASSVTSWRSAETGPDDGSTAAESEVCPASPLQPAVTAPSVNQHVIKRWSNRIAAEGSSVDTAPTATANAHPRLPNSSSLPVPRRKGGANPQRAPQHEPLQPMTKNTPPRKIKMPGSFQYSSSPLTPKSQIQTPDAQASRTPDSKTFLPDLKSSSTPKSSSLPLHSQNSAAQSPSLKSTPTSVQRVTNIPDFHNLLASPGATPPSPLSPSRRSVAALSPKFRYDHSGTKSLTPSSKNWQTLDASQSPRSSSAEGDSVPRLLILISGQSLSRGQASTRQQISTILNAHGIPFEEIDGSVLSVRDRRNELFKISGLWAQYPQFFIRENGQTAFWGTWDTLQQCNDAGKLVEEFSPKYKGGQNTLNTTAYPQRYPSPDPESRVSRVERIKRLAAKKRSPATASSEDSELIPPLLKTKSQPDDDGDDRVSMTSPSREPRSNYDIFDLRKIAPGVAEVLGPTRKTSSGNPSKVKLEQKLMREPKSLAMDQSVNGDSVAAHTIGESVATESTAPRLGAKSLDSLERREKKAKGESAKEKIFESDMHAILQPSEDEATVKHLSTNKKSSATLTSYPPPKNSLESSFGTLNGASTRILSPHLLSTPPQGASSPTSNYKASQGFSREQGSPAGSRTPTPVSTTGSQSSKLDFSSPRSRRMGQRLIAKKRELQAHRQRIKKTRSSDSSDVGYENDCTADSVASGGVLDAFQTRPSPATRNSPMTSQRSNTEPNEAYPGMRSTSTPSFMNQASYTSTRPEGNPMSASNLSRHDESHVSPSRNAPWSSQSAFSPLNGHSPRQGAFQPTHAHGFSSAVPSPKELGSPTSDSALSCLDVKSDCSNSVASRGSALSVRAEKLLKQRRQKRNLAGVDEVAEAPTDERKHARELTRNVVYGHPKHKSTQLSAEKGQKWNQLRVDTMESEDHTAGLRQLQADTTETDQTNYYPGSFIPSQLAGTSHMTQRSPNVIGPLTNNSSGGVAVDTSLTRQRASLSSRYTTSDRFMDQNPQNSSSTGSPPPPSTTRSLPDGATSDFAPHSTRSAPGRRIVYNGLYSDDTQDDTGASSEEFRSLSSQTSRTESAAHTARVMSGMDFTTDARSRHGIHDDFVAESAYSYDALRDAYSRMTLGQLAADMAGEVSSALNLDKIQDDVKKAFGGPSPGPRKKKRPGFVCTDLVPYDEEDVAIEVEYMEESVRGLCEAKGCGISSPSGQASFEPPRRRRVGEV